LNHAGYYMKLFLVCSWIYQTGALWHPILWKPWQMRLWSSYLHFWIYDSL